MRRALATLAIGTALLSALPEDASGQQCTAVSTASPRRSEGLRAARLIVSAVDSLRPRVRPGPQREPPRYPHWSQVGGAPLVAMWRGDGGPMGDLARKIAWGDNEPLPGWRMHWVADEDGYAFTLTDTRDACGFSYSSDERGDIVQGVNVDARRGVVPVETN